MNLTHSMARLDSVSGGVEEALAIKFVRYIKGLGWRLCIETVESIASHSIHNDIETSPPS